MLAALPRTLSQLTALKTLYVDDNKLPSTDVDFIIESFPQLKELGIDNLGLTGKHLRRTSVVRLHLCPQLCQTRLGSFRRSRCSIS